MLYYLAKIFRLLCLSGLNLDSEPICLAHLGRFPWTWIERPVDQFTVDLDDLETLRKLFALMNPFFLMKANLLAIHPNLLLEFLMDFDLNFFFRRLFCLSQHHHPNQHHSPSKTIWPSSIVGIQGNLADYSQSYR